ncbi:MAG: hypothetical protein PHF70_05770 [Opitutales bacterium]|nr:hypothetical protein [Opitutales bacterium]
MSKLLCVSELAYELRRSTKFVYRMRKLGFIMPGGTATLEEARAWLARNPSPFAEKQRILSTTGNESSTSA